MPLNKSPRANAPLERGVGNIHDRLNEARKKRALLLETSKSADTDRRVAPSRQNTLPPLSPPPISANDVQQPGRMAWALPVALGVLIVAILVIYARS